MMMMMMIMNNTHQHSNSDYDDDNDIHDAINDNYEDDDANDDMTIMFSQAKQFCQRSTEAPTGQWMNTGGLGGEW